MKAIVYRPKQLELTGSWRPRCLTDDRGLSFPDEYQTLVVMDVDGLEHACRMYSSKLGDVIILGEGDAAVVYAAGPLGWESVKFGRETAVVGEVV